MSCVVKISEFGIYGRPTYQIFQRFQIDRDRLVCPLVPYLDCLAVSQLVFGTRSKERDVPLPRAP